MQSIERFGASLVIVWAGSLLMGCSKKAPECNLVIGSLNELGAKLAEAQKVTGSNDSKPEQVAAALRPFATSSKLSGDKLSQAQITIAEIKKIASDASGAALALSANATKMADMADRMKGLDAAGKALDDQKKVVDAAQAGIEKICAASPAQCSELVKVLEKFPSPPEKADNMQVSGAWSAKLSGWAADLAKVKIDNAELKAQVSAYNQGWKTFAATMTTLVGITETAKKYDDVAKEFNAQIDVANKAVAAANGFCNAK